jgi:hypothetical protein
MHTCITMQQISTPAMDEYLEIYVQQLDEEPRYPIILLYYSRVGHDCFIQQTAVLWK